MALLVGGAPVGSVDGRVFEQIGLQRLLDKRYKLLIVEHDGASAWALQADDATAALNAIAAALRAAGRCGPWRDEQLAVCSVDGRRLATVERGATRVLGLATRAVHLVGCTADGAMWVQQRAHTKASNPGMWDTLMGGMVSAADSLQQAVERETWEEAGLRLAQLDGLAHGGQVDFGLPSDEGGGVGYMVERIDWYRATVQEACTPCNQDGEVERFARLAHAQVQALLAQGAFTPEAALVLAAFYGW
ncbi:MAG: NUDIX domain-containing protein [Proteobacteria bacterium]|nr:NUDIX domain-containing protein [Pseudomonadota bacterium]MBS0492697.1 NUDIX domain-containing protein [Pseudomonadota bacterium]